MQLPSTDCEKIETFLVDCNATTQYRWLKIVKIESFLNVCYSTHYSILLKTESFLIVLQWTCPLQMAKIRNFSNHSPMQLTGADCKKRETFLAVCNATTQYRWHKNRNYSNCLQCNCPLQSSSEHVPHMKDPLLSILPFSVCQLVTRSLASLEGVDLAGIRIKNCTRGRSQEVASIR